MRVWLNDELSGNALTNGEEYAELKADIVELRVMVLDELCCMTFMYEIKGHEATPKFLESMKIEI